MAQSDEYVQEYALKDIARHIAPKLGLTLGKAPDDVMSIMDAARRINTTPYFLRYAISRGQPLGERVLHAENDSSLIHYRAGQIQRVFDPTRDSGAVMAYLGEHKRMPEWPQQRFSVTEALIVTVPRRQILVTWGLPAYTGVIEVTDVPASLALQEIQSPHDDGPHPMTIAHIDAPEPRPVVGASQFRSMTESKASLRLTLERLIT